VGITVALTSQAPVVLRVRWSMNWPVIVSSKWTMPSEPAVAEISVTLPLVS
jgi:hypothetical protein